MRIKTLISPIADALVKSSRSQTEEDGVTWVPKPGAYRVNASIGDRRKDGTEGFIRVRVDKSGRIAVMDQEKVQIFYFKIDPESVKAAVEWFNKLGARPSLNPLLAGYSRQRTPITQPAVKHLMV